MGVAYGPGYLLQVLISLHQILNCKKDTAATWAALPAYLMADDILKQYILEAIELNERGFKVAKPKTSSLSILIIADYFTAFLKQHPLSSNST